MRKSRLIGLSISALLVVVSVGIVALTLFAVRRPVVVVTDAAFEELYGLHRAEQRKTAASLRLFRRIIIATVAESAAPIAAAEAAAAAAPHPACVVFPSRYETGAAAYAVRFKDIPMVVVGGSDSPIDSSVSSVPVRFSADKITDLYRAGRIAGLLCAEGGRPLFLTVSESESLEAFNAGLSDSGFSGEPVVLLPTEVPPSAVRFACLVAEASLRGSPALELRDLPLVLFSWIDPKLAPPGTAAIFDDSVWALLVPAVRSARGGLLGAAPSRVWFSTGSETKEPRRIKAAAASRYEDHNSL